MRHDESWLHDIIDAIDRIQKFIADLDSNEESFRESELHQSAVQYQLVVVGEACAKLSSYLRTRHPNVPWRDVKAFRNFAVHEYFETDWHLVWVTATKEVPVLREQIHTILSNDFNKEMLL